MRLTLLALLLVSCGGIEESVPCQQMAVDVCSHRLDCHEVDDVGACVTSEVRACFRAPDARLACGRAVKDQDCGQLHAHVIPDACQ